MTERFSRHSLQYAGRNRRLFTILGVLALLATLVIDGGTTRAQQPAPQTVVPGTAAIWTDKPQYAVGDPILVCYRVPIPGPITITDITADGTAHIFYSGPSSGTDGCIPGTVIPPTGTECMRLTFPLSVGTGVTQTCFQVVGSAPPPVQPGVVVITTDKPTYTAGDPFTFCYLVPGPGPVTITVTRPNGVVDNLLAGYDDGTGGCVPGTISSIPGVECLLLVYTYPNGQQVSASTCYQVTAPAPSEGWTFAGSALVLADGRWVFDQQVPLSATLTYVRVTSGGCGDAPNLVAVWESNLQRPPGAPSGIDVLAGYLLPVGLAASSGVNGYAATVRSLAAAQSPPTQVAAVLYGISNSYQGVPLNVCFRIP
jgi:hypothetical protein